MPSFQLFKNGDGSVSHVATINVKGFKRTSKAFRGKREARDWAEKLEAELRKQKERGTALRADVAALTIAGLAREYLADAEVTALRTYDSLERLMLWWASHHGAERVVGMNVLKLRAARDNDLRPGRSNGTVNRYVSALRSAWHWAQAAGLVPTDLAWPPRLMLPEPKGRTRHLSEDELKAVLEAAAKDPVMHAAVLLSIGCGIRQGELRRLRWSDVDMERQTVSVVMSKNGESRSVWLPQSAVDALKKLKKAPVVGTTIIADAEGQPLDKEQLIYKWHKVRDAAGLVDFRWHDLRHSCASFLAQSGASLLQIGGVLGHKSPTMTARYSHLVKGAPVPGHAELDAKLKLNL
jgi:integrase